MCGILGVVDHRNWYSEGQITEARDIMLRRGPDDHGYSVYHFRDSSVHLAHRRLSIIDLSSNSRQPLEDINERASIILNGEIYNYLELKSELEAEGYRFRTKSDTEVALVAFLSWGVQAFQKFVGMFSLAIYHRKEQSLYVVRDRVGVKPLYYHESNFDFSFSSDLMALRMLIPSSDISMNYSKIPHYLRYGYLVNESTMISSIKKLNAGCYIKYDLNSRTIDKQSYWKAKEFFKGQKRNLTLNEEVDLLRDVLKKAFGYRMVSDVPVGLFLSGGYDSALLCSILSQELNYKLKTFTVGFEDKRYDESRYARSVADHLQTEHHELICTKNDIISLVEKLAEIYDEPLGDQSTLPTLLVNEIASKHVKVVLSADGGDEIFGGYDHYTDALRAHRQLERVPLPLRRFANSLPNKMLNMLTERLLKRKMGASRTAKFKNILKTDSPLEIADILNSVSDDLLIKEDLLAKSSLMNFEGWQLRELVNESERMMMFNYLGYLEGDLLKKVDRASMYYSIEGREPFLDHKLFEHSAQTPIDFKITSDYKKKYILKSLTHQYLPEPMMNRPKMGFCIPLNDWVSEKGNLKELFFDTLSLQGIKDLELIDHKKVTLLGNELIKDGESGFQVLWNLFCLIRWKDRVFT